MSVRINISLSEKAESLGKQYAAKNKLKFSNLLELALQNFLQAEGYIAENKEVELFDMIREILASGHTAEEINNHLLSLGRKDVA